MRAFTQLCAELDRPLGPSEKVAALASYFRHAPAADAAWALWFLSGHRPRRAVKATLLRHWVAEAAALPLWLVEASYEHVGDLAETLALLLPPNPQPRPPPLAQLVKQRLLPLAGAGPVTQRQLVRATWEELDTAQRLLWHKLILGSFHSRVTHAEIGRALTHIAGAGLAALSAQLSPPLHGAVLSIEPRVESHPPLQLSASDEGESA